MAWVKWFVSFFLSGGSRLSLMNGVLGRAGMLELDLNTMCDWIEIAWHLPMQPD